MRHAFTVIAAVVLAACAGDGSPGATTVERTDSAGIEIVTSRGGDVPLAWTFERVQVVGDADEGATAFGGLYRNGIGVAPDGRLVILDPQSHRVVIVDEQGNAVREMGRQGGGPGEMEWPSALAVDDGGTISVFDMSKRGAVRFDTTGEVLEQKVLPPLAGIPPRLNTAFGRYWSSYATPSSGPDAPLNERLLGIGDADTVELTNIVRERDIAQFPNCAVAINLPPLFSPELRFSASSSGVAFTSEAAYSIAIWRDGRVVRLIRRDVPIQRATTELAATEVGDTFRITFGTGGCSIPPEDVVEARGFAEYVPAVRDLALAPDGTLFVARGIGPRTEWMIDVFAPDGAYVGTLPAGTPFPTAFRAATEIVTLERDELDRSIVVVYRLRSDQPPE